MIPRILSVFGTRPEAIKMAPVVKALEEEESLESLVAVSAQHREMLDQVLNLYGIKPHFDLDVMKERQELSGLTCRVLWGVEEVIKETQPQLVLVHGDTTTTFAAALAAFYQQVPVGHVEAGLRTGDPYHPFPEEINRRLGDLLSTLYFAPTEAAASSLKQEGVDPERIYVTGNTVVDALLAVVRKRKNDFYHPLWEQVDFDHKKVILLTAHRRENWGKPLENICRAVREVVEEYPQVEVVFPVHLNPLVQETASEILGQLKRVHLIEPLEYEAFAHLMEASTLILTDSGGIQEEAPSLGKPVLVLRQVTERPEAVEAGTVRVVGTDPRRIREELCTLLDSSTEYEMMSQAKNPFGDGRAAERIVKIIREYMSS